MEVKVMKCPLCGVEPFEVTVAIDKTAEGLFDDDSNLETETNSESIVALVCDNCHADIPLETVKNWR